MTTGQYGAGLFLIGTLVTLFAAVLGQKAATLQELGRIEKLVFIGALICILGAAIVFLSPTPARAHSWYDSDCCSEDDCRELDPSEVKSDGKDGWIWTSKRSGMVWKFPAKAGESKRLRTRMDEHFHGCEAPLLDDRNSRAEWISYCFYEKSMGY